MGIKEENEMENVKLELLSDRFKFDWLDKIMAACSAVLLVITVYQHIGNYWVLLDNLYLVVIGSWLGTVMVRYALHKHIKRLKEIE